MAIIGKYSQTPTENKLYTVDYTQWLAQGETLTGVTITVQQATSPAFSISNQVIGNGTAVSFYAGGGVANQTYEAVIEVTTSLAQVKDDSFYFAVKNI